MTIKNNRAKWTLTAILLFTALLYIRSLFNNFAGWDDDGYILQNIYIRNFNFDNIKTFFTIFYKGNYHPFTMLTYLFEYNCFGLKPFLYHLMNVLMHLLNTFLVYKITGKLSGKKITALVVSLLFAIHPMHVESVAWISERKDVLYTLFYLLSIKAYLKYLESECKRKFYINTILLFLASLLSKSASVTLPVLLIVIDIYKRRKINKKVLFEKTPFILLSLLFGIIAIYAQRETGAVNNLSVLYSFSERIFIFTYTVAFYLIKTIFPVGLCAMHYFPNTQVASLSWQYYLSLPFLLLLAWAVYKFKTLQRDTLFGISFFLITISVMLQIVSVGSAITAERYTYVPYIGLFYIAGQWGAYILERKTNYRNIIIIIFSLFIFMYSYQTWERIGKWKNGYVLFDDVVKKNPDYYHGYWIRGNMKKNDGDFHGALKDLNNSMKYNPGFASCLVTMGDVLNKIGNYNEAIRDLSIAIVIDSSLSEAYVYRAVANEGIGNVSKALQDYTKAIKIKPDYAFAYNNRSVLKAKTGDITGALADINKAIVITPDDPKTYSNRGNIKAIMKDYKGSVEDYTKTLKLKPNDNMAFYNRGLSYLNINDTIKACEDWQKAMNLGDQDAMQKSMLYCH